MRLVIPKILSRLLVKILFAYMAVTVLSWIVSSTLLGLIQYYQLQNQFEPEAVRARYAEKAAGAARYLDGSPNAAALRLWLQTVETDLLAERSGVAPDIYSNLDKSNSKRELLAIFDRDGHLLVTNDANNAAALNSPVEKHLLAETLRRGAVNSFADDKSVICAVPITGANGTPAGVLLAHSNVPLTLRETLYKLTWNWYDLFGTMIVMFAGTGLVFSFFLARSLTRRLERIAVAANSWSVGDFKTRATDRSSDEIGLLARRLNSMATDLNEFFRLKQDLAALAERNKLARDLHDSVKQQVFALSMQLGAAKLLSKRDSHEVENRRAADAHLAEAEKLAHAVQRELVDLINELRPPEQKNESLIRRLENFAADWKRQSKIAVRIVVVNAPPSPLSLPPAVELAFFRIAQEALANVARHSAARTATIEIAETRSGELQLVISDDGTGFDAATIKRGLGLTNMRERAESLPNGRFSIESQTGGGTRIVVGCRIQLKTKEVADAAVIERAAGGRAGNSTGNNGTQL